VQTVFPVAVAHFVPLVGTTWHNSDKFNAFTPGSGLLYENLLRTFFLTEGFRSPSRRSPGDKVFFFYFFFPDLTVFITSCCSDLLAGDVFSPPLGLTSLSLFNNSYFLLV